MVESSKRRSCKKIAAWLALVFVFAAAIILWCIGGCFSRAYYMSSREWVISMIKEHYYKDIDDDVLNNCDYTKDLSSILDIYSAYYTKEELALLNASNSGSRSGVGITVQYIGDKEDGTSYNIGGGVYISSIVGNSPAYKSGMRAGMFLVSGQTSDGNVTQFTSLASVTTFISERGTDEEFMLVCNDGNEDVSYTLNKKDYQGSYCFMSTNETAWDCNYYGTTSNGVLRVEQAQESRVVSYLPDGFAYMSLSQFYGNAPTEMAYLLEKFNSTDCTSLIIDLRNNGGGYVQVMLDLAYLLTANYNTTGSLVGMYAQNKYGNKSYYYMSEWAQDKYTLAAGKKVYVLANSSSASASEALVGALISYDVIDYSDIYLSDFSEDYLTYMQSNGYGYKNKRSYGKGIMQTTYVNPNSGEAIKLTTDTIYWPNGTCIHDRGVTESDGCKTATATWSVTYADEELQSVINDLINR